MTPLRVLLRFIAVQASLFAAAPTHAQDSHWVASPGVMLSGTDRGASDMLRYDPELDDYFRAWESGSPEADYNQDGGVDGDDAAAFIAQWTAGC